MSTNFVSIPVSAIEFYEGGNTIWIHAPHGGTTLRIKCTGKIVTETCENSPVSHGDILIQGDLNICLSKDAIKE